jgi:glycosyltransferase involved in cell wall biosynthesis
MDLFLLIDCGLSRVRHGELTDPSRCFSVGHVIPIRNTPLDYLQRSILSVKTSMREAQADWNPRYVVVVDDASESSLSTAYRTICSDFSVTFIRVDSWIGIGGARWRGVLYLSTLNVSHVMFVDSDDELLPDGVHQKVKSAQDDTIVAGPYEISGRYAESYLAETKELIVLASLLGVHKSNPALYVNIVGHGALIPLNVLCEEDFPARVYSGEFVTLWAQLLFSGRAKLIHIDGPPAYRYEVRKDGNYSRDVQRHRMGVSAALAEMRRKYLFEKTSYEFVAPGGRLPSLYAPRIAERWLLPDWCELSKGGSWMITERYRSLGPVVDRSK